MLSRDERGPLERTTTTTESQRQTTRNNLGFKWIEISSIYPSAAALDDEDSQSDTGGLFAEASSLSSFIRLLLGLLILPLLPSPLQVCRMEVLQTFIVLNCEFILSKYAPGEESCPAIIVGTAPLA